MTAAAWFVIVYGAVALGSSWWLDARWRKDERGRR